MTEELPKVKIIETLEDCRYEWHKAFRSMWNQVGTIGRLRWVLDHPDSALRDEVVQEVTAMMAKPYWGKEELTNTLIAMMHETPLFTIPENTC